MLCARYAAALSGDADTVGAMSCAIAGAWHGAEAIPKELTAKLHSANPELDFVGVARGLSEIARGGPQ
jgi:ADP-ribosylglycohydrolase